MKKKGNFLIQFALQSKYNFFVCVVALLVLLFSVSSLTFAWIEGANAFTINSTGSKTVNATGDYFRAARISPAELVTNSLNLSNYIDPKELYLAPAKGEITANNEIDVQFKNPDGTTYRPADTNDISNNYVFFELKVHAEDLITDYVFDSSSIMVGTTPANDIFVGVTVLDKNRTALGSKITTAKDVAKNVVATDTDNFLGFQQDEDYIIQFKIWSDGSLSYSSNVVAFDLTLVPEKGVTTITFQDFTNSNTGEYLLTAKRQYVYAEYAGKKVAASSYDSANHLYTFTDIPNTQLANVTISAYDSSTASTPYAEWTPGFTKEKKAYTAYGGITDGTNGTFNPVHKINFIDSSNENLLKADKDNVKIKTITDNLFAMYNNGGTTKYTVYLPESEFKGGKVVFSNDSTYYATTNTLSTSARYYHIMGETKDTVSSEGHKLCVGKLYTTDHSSSFITVTLKDATKGKKVCGTGGLDDPKRVYVSYAGMTTPYMANYTSAHNGTWKITAFSDTDSMQAWQFDAYINDSDTSAYYSWDGADRAELEDGTISTTYTFLNAIEGGTTPTDGTWIPPLTSNIGGGILQETKVSFYAGAPTSWNPNKIYLSSTSASGNYDSGTDIGIDGANISNVQYDLANIIEVSPSNYYLRHASDYNGVRFGETSKGGKFYGVNSTGVGENFKVSADPTTGSTMINGKTSSSSSAPASIEKGSGSVDFATALSSVRSIAQTDLWIEYFAVNGTTIDTEDYEFLGKVEHADLRSDSDNVNQFDLSSYTSTANNIFQVVTVLTDGKVYYVADRDYLKVIDTSAYKKVTVSSVANATIKATYGTTTINEGETKSVPPGTEIKLSATPASGYTFTKFKVYNADTNTLLLDTAVNNLLYKVEANIRIEATITKSANRVVYFDNSESNWGEPYVHLWNSSNANQNNGGWPGKKMTHVSGNIWKYEITDSAWNSVIFNNNAGTQTGDLTIPTDGKNLFTWTGVGNDKGTWSKYDPTQPTTKRIYIYPGQCSWFISEGYYPAISYSGHDSFIYLKDNTIQKDGKTYYYCDVPSDVSGITLRRQDDSGTNWNSATISNPSASQNLFTVASNWLNSNPNGTWSIFSP